MSQKKKTATQAAALPERVTTYVTVRNLAIIVALALPLYIPTFSFEFTNWDDPVYVLNNELIRSIDPGALFSTYVWGNYHPLTMFTLAVEYQLVGTEPFLYHLDNLLLHLGNALLAYFIFFRLFRSQWVAVVSAVCFAVHPMHVESVAWVSERKDVLHIFFYLLSMLFYLQYHQKDRSKLYFGLTIGAFVLALLSKATAVTLPVILLWVDFQQGRKLDKSAMLEKLPLLALSLLTGIVAIMAQREAIPEGVDLNFLDRIFVAGYAYVVYLVKLFLPYGHSAFYPYPEKVNGMLPWYFYPMPFLTSTILWVAYYLRYRVKGLWHGMLFYSITIVLVLQLLPVGGAMMAERYTYLPYLGLYPVIMIHLWQWYQKGKMLNRVLVGGLLVLWMGPQYFTTLERVRVWNNSGTLWTDVIRQYPQLAMAYQNRGGYFEEQGQIQKALTDFNKAIELKPAFAPGYYNRAKLYQDAHQLEAALKDYEVALRLDPDFVDAYYNRGLLFQDTRQFQQALEDYNKVLGLQPGHLRALNNRGVVYRNMGAYDKARQDFDQLLQSHPNYIEAWINRGNLFLTQRQYQPALDDYNQALQLDPAKGNAYYNRAQAYYFLGNKAAALQDALKAKSLGIAVDPKFIELVQ